MVSRGSGPAGGGHGPGRLTPQARYDGLDAAALAQLTLAPRAEVFDMVTSTLDVVHELGASDAPGGSIALADAQTAGRGRGGRAWQSPPGAGIWLSVLLRPAAPPQGGVLAIRTGLAVHAALATCAPQARVDLKWPNDVVLRGLKVGGVLCEARWQHDRLAWVGVGIGLNVHGPLPADVQPTAAALADSDGAVSRLEILEALVPLVAALAARPAQLDERERQAFLERLWMPEGTGQVVGLEPDGALLVRGPDGGIVRRTDAT